MSEEIVVLLTLVFIAVVVVVIPLLLLERRQKTRLTSLAQKIGGTVKGADIFVGNYQGADYRFKYYPGGKNAPSYFQVIVPGTFPGSFQVVRETQRDQFFKRIGISSEVQTNDLEFDKAFYILTDTVEFASRFFLIPENRKIVKELFQAGFGEVGHDGKAITATLIHPPALESIDPAFVQETIPKLSQMLRGTPISPIGEASIVLAPWKAVRVFAFGISVALILGGFVLSIIGSLYFPPLDGGMLFLDSLRYSVPAFVLFLFFAASLLKGRASSHKELGSLLTLYFFAFPLFGYGLEEFLNGQLDVSPAAPHMATVVSRYTTRSKGSTTYHVEVKSWRKGREREHLTVWVSDYNRVVAAPHHSQMRVVTKPVQLGFEWVVSQEVVKP